MELRNGVVDAAARLPFRRWVEVELHHVDLGIGHELEDLSEEFTEREIDFLAERFDGHPEVPPTPPRRTARARGTPAGSAEGPRSTVTGPAGRPPGLALRAAATDPALALDGGPLPALPPL